MTARVKENRAENGPNMRDLGRKWRMASRRIANGRSIRHSPWVTRPPMKPMGSLAVVPRFRAGRGKMAEDIVTTTGIARHGATRLPSVDVDSFNIELKDDDGFLGDRASKGAFRKILDTLRKPLKKTATIRSARRFRRTRQERTRRGPGRRRHPRLGAGARRDRGIRPGTGLCDRAVSQDQGLGRYRTHRGRRRLSAEPGRRTRDRAHRHHPQGRRISRSIWCRSAFIPTKPA